MVRDIIEKYEMQMKLIINVTYSIGEHSRFNYVYALDTIVYDNKVIMVDKISSLVNGIEAKVHPLSGAPTIMGTISGVGFYNETFKFQIITKNKLKIVYNWKRFILDE